MAERKPRKVVEDLQQGGPGRLEPAAEPRALNSYQRPGEQEVGRPLQTNPLSQLAASLSQIEPTLQRYVHNKIADYKASEDAVGEKQFWDNREKANEMIKVGEIPMGASPYAVRGFQRAALKQLGNEYHSSVYSAFHGPEGAEARESNDPTVMRKFLDSSYQKFSQEWMSKSGYFTDLDMQEVFHPALEKTNAAMMAAHSEHRVKEIERQYEDIVSVQSESILEQELGQLSDADGEDARTVAYKKAGERMNDLLYNFDTGAVKNGVLPKRGNELLIDAITQKAMKTGNRSMLEVANHIKTKEGAPIGNTRENQAKIIAAEEHITREYMQKRHFEHWEQGLPHEAKAREHTEKSWAVEEQRWEEHKTELLRQQANIAHQETVTTLTRRMYQALRAPTPEQKTQAVNDVIRIAEEVAPQEVKELQAIIDTATRLRTHAEDDSLVIGQFYLDMERDPLGFDSRRLRQAAGVDHTMTSGTMMRMFDDLDRKRANASHPYIRQEEFREMLHQVSRGALQNPGDEFTAEGQSRAADALGAFRGKAAAWIEMHPQGGVAEFNDYMREMIKPVLEKSNPDFGTEQKRIRDKKEGEGRAIVEDTQKLVQKKEQIQAERKAKADAEQKVKGDRDTFNREFQASGRKTKEGRPVLENAKGDIATERTITIKGIPEINNGGVTNIPTIFNGKLVSDEEAIEIMKKNKGVDPDTGQKMRRYWSIKDAEIAARERSARLGKEYSKPEVLQPIVEKQPEKKDTGFSLTREVEASMGVQEIKPKVTPEHLRTLLTGEQKTELATLRERVIKPGISEKPVTQEQLKDRVMEMLKPIYKEAGASPSELADGVSQLMRVLLPRQQDKKRS